MPTLSSVPGHAPIHDASCLGEGNVAAVAPTSAISGDTAPSTNLVKLARDADVLVHSVMYPPAIDRLVGLVPNAATLKESILAHQTSAEDAGRMAQTAGVKTLVLSHLVPADDPQVTDQMWIDAAQSRFQGKVILGRDLLEI